MAYSWGMSEPSAACPCTRCFCGWVDATCDHLADHPVHWSLQLGELVRRWWVANRAQLVIDAADMALDTGLAALVDFEGCDLYRISRALMRLEAEHLVCGECHGRGGNGYGGKCDVCDGSGFEIEAGRVVSYGAEGERGEPVCPHCEEPSGSASGCSCGVNFREDLASRLAASIAAE